MPDDMTLLARQKKRTLEICQEAGLLPHEFRWEVVHVGGGSAPKVSRLVHAPSGFYFLFDFTPDGRHVTEFSPHDTELKFRDQHSRWDTRFKYIERWARNLAEEIEAQDFIKRIEEGRPLEQLAIAEKDNAPLSPEEQEQIEVRLGDLETHVLQIREFQEEEASQIKQQFQQLRDELRRAGRNSWLQMLIGVLVTIGVGYFDPDAARVMWAYANEHIGGWYHTLRLSNE